MQQDEQQLPLLYRLTSLPGFSAVAVAVFFLIAGTYFGSTRDFGAFLLSLLVLPLAFLVVLVPTIWASCVNSQRRLALVAWLLIGLTVPAYFLSYGVIQRARFLSWASAHYAQLAQASRKNGIIMGWDSWGMAGQDTFSYLVVDTEDRLGLKARADKWTHQVGQTCGLWQTQRMWPKLYVVTTYTNCPYDGVPAN